MATTYLTRTSGTPTNALKWTFSTWVKIASIPNDTFLLIACSAEDQKRGLQQLGLSAEIRLSNQ